MNFNIVDGDNQYRELLPVFSEMYNDKQIRVTEIKKQLGIGVNEYKKLRRDAIQEGLVKPRTKQYKRKRSYKTNPKYVQKTIYKGIEYYQIHRVFNGKRYYYGNFRNYRQAERMVELLYENDWDINKRDELKEQVMMEWKEKKRNTANVVIPGDQEHYQK